MTKAIDVSAAPPPSDQQIACLKAQGVVKAIVGTSYAYGGDPAARIAAYKKGGLAVAEYQFPRDLKPLLTDEWWCDVETPPGATKESVRAACGRDPRPVGIYSSQTMWNSTVGAWNIKAEFPWLKVWIANYGTLPRPFRPFGGFTEDDVVMYQYAGNATLCGLSVDINEIMQECSQEEIKMPKVVWCPDEGRVYLVGFAALIWITSQAEVDQLVKAYGEMITLSKTTINQMHP